MLLSLDKLEKFSLAELTLVNEEIDNAVLFEETKILAPQDIISLAYIEK